MGFTHATLTPMSLSFKSHFLVCWGHDDANIWPETNLLPQTGRLPGVSGVINIATKENQKEGEIVKLDIFNKLPISRTQYTEINLKSFDF